MELSDEELSFQPHTKKRKRINRFEDSSDDESSPIFENEGQN